MATGSGPPGWPRRSRIARRVIRENSGISVARRAASVGVARSAGQGQS
ncbi:hypothetical protein ACWEOS_30450 [Micromonospora taraxaci]